MTRVPLLFRRVSDTSYYLGHTRAFDYTSPNQKTVSCKCASQPKDSRKTRHEKNFSSDSIVAAYLNASKDASRRSVCETRAGVRSVCAMRAGVRSVVRGEPAFVLSVRCEWAFVLW